jgi:hypothetical protein
MNGWYCRDEEKKQCTNMAFLIDHQLRSIQGSPVCQASAQPKLVLA